MTLKEKVNDYIRSIMNKFKQTKSVNFRINEQIERLDSITKNQVWYRGEPSEISQMYQQNQDFFGKEAFWAKAPSSNKVATRHYPLPQTVVDVLTNLSVNDIEEIEIKDDDILNEILQKIKKDSGDLDFIEENIKEQLISGDCGVYPRFWKSGKITFEICKSENCEYNEFNEEWYVKQILQKEDKNFCFVTVFGKGYVKYKLYTENGTEISLSEFEKLKDLQDVYFKNGEDIDEDLCLFVLFKSFNSTKFKNRGKSLYDGRDGAFDLVDEAYSTWGTALRKSTPKTFIDKSMTQRDQNGNPLPFSDYDLDIITTGSSTMMGENGNKVETYNPAFPSADYYQTLNMAIQAALIQIISPTSAGIDMRVYQSNVNTSYTQEIEKTTMQTHNKILYSYAKALRELILTTFKAYSYLTGMEIDFAELDENISIKFNDFSTPSSDKIIPLFSQAVNAEIMSKEEAIREWHTEWTDKQVEEELAKIKNEMPTIEDAALWGLEENIEDTTE